MDVRVSGSQAQITLDLRDLEDILDDLRYVAEVEGELEPRTQDLVEALCEKGIW